MTENTTENKSNIYLGDNAIKGIVSGINKVADAVKITLGAAGKNVIIEQDVFPFHIITNDGISIAESCFFQDPLEQRGADLVKEVNKLTDRGSKDGRTTTTVLMQAIINEGLKYENKGMEIKNSLQELIPFIEEEIDKQKKVITEDDVASVARISGENDHIANLIQEICKQVGKDGIIYLENSKTDETHYQLKEGVRFNNAQLASTAFFTDEAKTKAEYVNPLVLVAQSRIGTMADMEAVLSVVATGDNKKLVIFCDEIDNSVASALVTTHLAGQFNIALIKAPVVWKDLIIEDFAKVTGATIVSDLTGLRFQDIKLEHLGTCGKLVADKHETIVLGIKDISEHIENLKNSDEEYAALRLSWLNTKAAVLKVGAGSESDLSYLKRKASDAIHSSMLALQDGVVPGGGLALYNASELMPDTLGGNILRKALKAPINQIMENAGYYDDRIGGEIGFDAITKLPANMWETRIIDPAKVVKNAVRNAISVASIALTAGAVITKKPKSDDEKAQDFMKSLRPF